MVTNLEQSCNRPYPQTQQTCFRPEYTIRPFLVLLVDITRRGGGPGHPPIITKTRLVRLAKKIPLRASLSGWARLEQPVGPLDTCRCAKASTRACRRQRPGAAKARVSGPWGPLYKILGLITRSNGYLPGLLTPGCDWG